MVRNSGKKTIHNKERLKVRDRGNVWRREILFGAPSGCLYVYGKPPNKYSKKKMGDG